MGYRYNRARGHFTAASSHSGHGYIASGRRVTVSGQNFQINWNGPVIADEIILAVQDAFKRLSDEALSHMQSIVPVDTGATRDSCFAYVDVGPDNKISLVIGAGTPYAVYIELGTFSHTAQPFIRPTFDMIISQLPGLLEQEVSTRALSIG